MFDRYDAIAAQAPDLEKCDREMRDRIRLEFDFLPKEYAEFLGSVGWGEVAGLMFYSGPLELNEIFDKETVDASAKIILIADDMAGWHVGYVKIGEDWMLTDFDHIELPGHPSPVNVTLAEYVMSRLNDSQ